MTMRYVIAICLLFLPAVTPARDLTLTQALDLAEAHSFALKKSQAASDAAKSGVDAAKADRLPTFSASASANYISYVPSLTIALPGLPPISRSVGTHDNYQTDLRLSLPLYTGGKISGGIALADANRELSDALLSASRDQLDYLTRVEYFTLYRSDRQLEVAKASLTRAETINKDANSLYAAGAADSVSLLDASLALTRATFAVKQAETARRASELRLLTYLGLEPTETVNLTDSLSLPSEDSWSTTVDSTKPELKAAAAALEITRRRYNLTRSDYFPTLAAIGGYSYGMPNLDRFNNTWNDYFTIGASLTWTFNLGGKVGMNRQTARYNMQAASYDRDQTAENLGREARLAVEQLKLANQRYASALEEYKIASDNYRLASAQHRDGTLTSNRLVTIEADLTSAQASLSSALVDFHIAQSAYYYAIGSPNLRKGN